MPDRLHSRERPPLTANLLDETLDEALAKVLELLLHELRTILAGERGGETLADETVDFAGGSVLRGLGLRELEGVPAQSLLCTRRDGVGNVCLDETINGGTGSGGKHIRLRDLSGEFLRGEVIDSLAGRAGTEFIHSLGTDSLNDARAEEVGGGSAKGLAFNRRNGGTGRELLREGLRPL